MDLLAEFPIVIHQPVIWNDMDAYQHVNNTVYFRYFEDARMAYFEKTRVSEFKELHGIGPILASTRCDFRAPLTYPDNLRIGARVVEIAEKKFVMQYRVVSEKLNAVAAEGEGLIVYYDYQNARSCKIPAEILSAMQAIAE
ncbi:MAG: acyl-CoA thioesterase [Oceanospirillaceae bacterium]|nr:acyl-CoA thioesterase [Oceanospirillaceae bacterium]MCP5335643.1 acyl-CoA thioesterase [Oceanospirillaceae bacterium]